VPDLDLNGSSSINVEYTPIIFAPLVAHGESRKEDLGLSIFDTDCHCGEEKAGFGNACALQQSIQLPGGRCPKLLFCPMELFFHMFVLTAPWIQVA